MAFDKEKAFEVNEGLIIDGAGGFFSGSGNPTDDAPNGSFYTDTASSKLWQRVLGVWQEFSGSTDSNIEGGSAGTVYLLTQVADGGGA